MGEGNRRRRRRVVEGELAGPVGSKQPARKRSKTVVVRAARLVDRRVNLSSASGAGRPEMRVCVTGTVEIDGWSASRSGPHRCRRCHWRSSRRRRSDRPPAEMPSKMFPLKRFRTTETPSTFRGHDDPVTGVCDRVADDRRLVRGLAKHDGMRDRRRQSAPGSAKTFLSNSSPENAWAPPLPTKTPVTALPIVLPAPSINTSPPT